MNLFSLAREIAKQADDPDPGRLYEISTELRDEAWRLALAESLS